MFMITCYTLYIVVCNIFGHLSLSSEQFFFSFDQLQPNCGLTEKKPKKNSFCGCSPKKEKTGLNWTLKH